VIDAPSFTQETGINVRLTSIAGTQMPAQTEQGRPRFDLISISMKERVTYADQMAWRCRTTSGIS
jgi:hypothetical protein